ncbi:fluoride efflux transporter FluC [Schaalia vaccimaxillae]|uniref:fluoride efflux transporter FluC n=1 Tax=Schaalia vaccimaxillae TaxID=183916 RepID=UPI0013F3E28B|nr:CrcB family protein [Schaalia vaccimaxillae]
MPQPARRSKSATERRGLGRKKRFTRVGTTGASDWIFVAAGGALGALCRGLVDACAGAHIWSDGFGLIWSTVIVNLVGATLLGILHAIFAHAAKTSSSRSTKLSDHKRRIKRAKLVLATGFAGAFTTYGAVMTQTLNGTGAEIVLARLPGLLLQSLALLATGLVVTGGADRITGRILGRFDADAGQVRASRISEDRQGQDQIREGENGISQVHAHQEDDVHGQGGPNQGGQL